MKKLFSDPDIQVVTFSVEDIITTSGGGVTDPDFPDPVVPGNQTPVVPGP